MRTTLAAIFTLACAATGHAGPDPSTKPARSDTAPRPELDRKPAETKPTDGKQLCTYVSPDPNAPSERTDCIAQREPAPQRPVEKTPPAGPGNDATPSRR